METAKDPFDVLVWLVWPTDGLEELLEAGAFRILEVDSEMAPESDDKGTLSWTVTIELTDVPELRRLAVQAHPDKAQLSGGARMEPPSPRRAPRRRGGPLRR